MKITVLGYGSLALFQPEILKNPNIFFRISNPFWFSEDFDLPINHFTD